MSEPTIDDLEAKIAAVELHQNSIDSSIPANLHQILVDLGDEAARDRDASTEMRERITIRLDGMDVRLTALQDSSALDSDRLDRIDRSLQPLMPLIHGMLTRNKTREAFQTIWKAWKPSKKFMAVVTMIASSVAGVVAYWAQVKNVFVP